MPSIRADTDSVYRARGLLQQLASRRVTVRVLPKSVSRLSSWSHQSQWSEFVKPDLVGFIQLGEFYKLPSLGQLWTISTSYVL